MSSGENVAWIYVCFFRFFYSINRCLSNRFISLVWNSKCFNRLYKLKAFKECVQAFKNKRSSVGTMPRAKSSNWWYYAEQKKTWLQIGMYLNEFLFFEVLFIWCCSWCSHRHRSLFNCHLVLRTRDKFQLNNIQLWTKEEEKFTVFFFFLVYWGKKACTVQRVTAYKLTLPRLFARDR